MPFEKNLPPGKRDTTSWGSVEEWYSNYIAGDDTYQIKVILPNLLRVLALVPKERVLDLACGEGFFGRECAKKGAIVAGADIAPELIEQARKKGGGITYHVTPASDLSFSKDGCFDVVICVLALQNIEDMGSVCKEVRRVLGKNGRFVMVVNHPAFRVPKRSQWGFDDFLKVQYRRVDGYLSGAKIAVDMEPGKDKGKQTISYHRSFQDFFKTLTAHGFAVTKLEEWISHKKSGAGPRQKAEDTARKEIPLFAMIEARMFEKDS